MGHTIKPLIIPVFIPHSGCPHQCAFCNQTIITNQKPQLPGKKHIHEIITEYSNYKGTRKKAELAFFGGNFLGLEHSNIIELLDYAQQYVNSGKIDGIRFSTRPDTITYEILNLIKPYTISAIELGVQSMNDIVLIKSKRGHTCNDTESAMLLLKKYGFKTGAQVMVGLPGDDKKSLLESTEKIAGLGPDFARIYPLVILKGSLMAKWYVQGSYQPLSLDKSVYLVKKMFNIFQNKKINIIRMGLQASDIMNDKSMVLAGPWHPAFGHLVLSEIMFDKVCCKLDQYQKNSESKKIAVIVHPSSESRLRGDKNVNMKKLIKRYPQFDISIDLNDSIARNNVKIKSLL